MGKRFNKQAVHKAFTERNVNYIEVIKDVIAHPMDYQEMFNADNFKFWCHICRGGNVIQPHAFIKSKDLVYYDAKYLFNSLLPMVNYEAVDKNGLNILGLTFDRYDYELANILIDDIINKDLPFKSWSGGCKDGVYKTVECLMLNIDEKSVVLLNWVDDVIPLEEAKNYLIMMDRSANSNIGDDGEVIVYHYQNNFNRFSELNNNIERLIYVLGDDLMWFLKLSSDKQEKEIVEYYVKIEKELLGLDISSDKKSVPLKI